VGSRGKNHKDLIGPFTRWKVGCSGERFDSEFRRPFAGARSMFMRACPMRKNRQARKKAKFDNETPAGSIGNKCHSRILCDALIRILGSCSLLGFRV
jgi:hypothetical protein